METPAWQARYRAQIQLWSALAHQAPERGLVVTNPSGFFQLHAWDVRTGELRQLTRTPQGTIFGAIASDGTYVYAHTEMEGNEFGHWERIPFDGGPEESLTPDMPPYASFFCAGSADGRRIGFNAVSAEGISVLVIDVEPDGRLGSPRRLLHGSFLMAGPVLSTDGGLAVVMSNERATGGLEFCLLAIDSDSGERVAELWDGNGTSVEALMFSPLTGDERILGSSNRAGMNRPFLWNPRTGERTDLDVDTLEGDIKPLDWSDDGHQILLGQVNRATHRLHLYDLASGIVRTLDHPTGTWGPQFSMAAYFGPNGEIYAHFQDSTQPERLVTLNASGQIERTVLPAGDAPPGRRWTSITFPSDGQEIHGWLCVPDGVGPFPTILHTHGGPTAVAFETFDPGCQAFVDRGFAFCTINYHGSTTFGKEFQESINGDLGRREVADMVAARNWLVENGVADPDRVILAGRSYGGYLTLMALGLHPELWAGGMAGVPVTDWTMLYEDSPGTRAYAVALLKGTPEERSEQYRISSPLTYVNRVRAPVLVLFGRNDMRCPARPVEAYIEGLRTAGTPVEVHEFQGGHLGAFTNIEEAIREEERMLAFALGLVRAQPEPALLETV
jgi:dipeptidyl aminopeptidase/acylaminoacyl peptidase